MKLFTTLILLVVVTSISAIEPYYHSIKAHKGDGIYSILRRYHLIDHDCNKNEFLKLNNIKINDKLHVGKEYKLPIKIYEYDGKSIRSTIGIKDFKQAVRIKEYNDQILSENLRKTSYMDSKILWVPYHEFECNITSEDIDNIKEVAEIEDTPATIPTEAVKKDEAKKDEAKAKYETISLFGKKNEKVNIESDDLKGEVYYIVSGHGGIDPGAMCTDCPDKLCEDEYAYDVSLRLSRKLISNGATVHIIVQDKNDGIREAEILKCDTDETIMGKKITSPQQLYRLRRRAGAVNHQYMKHKKDGVKKQVAIMVHVDSNTKDKRMDAYFFHHKTSKSSKVLAESMRSKFEEKYNYYQKDRGYKGFVRDCNLFMINNTYPTSVLVELANIKNKTDQKRLTNPHNRELLAQWMYEGIVSAKI
jgi:N-acetylmuramoyl-L-alanine amidase